MSTTERLYYTDSHLTEFEARVIHATEKAHGLAAVTLDRTAFYPMGGGQPSDTGSLAEARVVECIDEGESVLHIIEGPPPETGVKVTGRIDWPRRLDHLQQHTGQHILSQSFVKLFNAETRSFRMMEHSSEIDVALEGPTDERIGQAVALANSIIWGDRKVRVLHVTQDEAARLPLRKDSAREGELRIIEIEGFDMSPCGGTHAHRTGEVGLVAVRSWERAKGLLRLEFVAGGRALADYDRANRSARAVAALFSVGRDEAEASVARLLEENKRLARQVRALEEVTARTEAAEMLKGAEHLGGGVRLVKRLFEGRDADSLKRYALAIIEQGPAVALLGSSDAEMARLVFARSAAAPGDMNVLMRQACALLDGRGGGRPDMAQGGGRNLSQLADAIEQAAAALLGQ